MGGHAAEPFDPAANVASQADMVDNRIPLGCVLNFASALTQAFFALILNHLHSWRDNCSGLLIPLNKCRHASLYAPWSQFTRALSARCVVLIKQVFVTECSDER